MNSLESITPERKCRTGSANPPLYRSGIHKAHRTLFVTMVAALIIMVFSVDVHAQSGGFSGAFTRMGFGARGMAMGNAIGSVSQDGVYAHYNPALSADITNNQFDLGTALMSFDRSLHSVNATFPLPPNAGLSFGLLNANVYDIDGRTSSGYHTDYLSTHEFQFFAAFGISINPRIRLGASVKLQLASFHEEISNSTGAGFDIGMILSPTDSWRIGFAAQDLVSEYSWNTSDLYGGQDGRSKSDPFPNRFRLSTSYRFAETGLTLSSEYEIQRQSSEYQRLQVASGVLPPRNSRQTDNITTSSHQIRFGASWDAHERITLRGGWEVLDLDFLEETHKVSAGFSVHLPYDALSPSIDYAFVREPMGIAGMHVLNLRLSL
ncbi:OmpP1/FadL family transporter [Natronogracilivirga saccharolytica]|uniref:PorV/PorQ family protein n=1 Tax=Natronogracilivirga saccharolytica TaxID=2812953 RepID=A0A8J7UVC9_9BACT|nr:hypothetical protein [Natronogracilivirga saccharolytica]MBP3192421.1 hypothetical protein [Natronogracilivirga saccharolytica]